MRLLLSIGFMAALSVSAQSYTRGIGVYPGDPKDYFGPTFKIDSTTYRNLALRRPAFHSSSYDYNLTPQLVTDGIKDTRLPRWIAVATPKGELKKEEREGLVDDNPVTGVELRAPGAWVQIELPGGEAPLEVDRIDVDARSRGGAWSMVISGSDDGQSWTELGRAKGTNAKGDASAPSWNSVPLKEASRSRIYRVAFEGSATGWYASSLRFFRAGQRVRVGGPFDFTSAWKSAGTGEEWVYVDLGAVCTFDRVTLSWIRRAAEAAVQASDDARSWRTIQTLAAGPGAVDDVKLAQPVQARYVRVLMTRAAAPEGYILSELEVFGRGGPVPVAHALAAPRADGRQDLAGGGWRVQRDSQVAASGSELSKPGFRDAEWVPATVPGTTLTSYYNAGVLDDPNFGDNQVMISDSFFYADFWYRDEFTAPAAAPGKRVWLNFDGINWKADVYLNGEKLGRIEGGFLRSRFDVTDRIKAGEKNALAVRVEKNANPGSVKQKTFLNPDKNGGILGADNPTYHASIGWDWIPTIRGRNTGMWNDVYLTQSGPVTLENPFVNTVLPLGDTTRADLTVEATLRNHDSRAILGTLRGRIGEVSFETPVTVPAASAITVKLDPSSQAALRLKNPKLWWPNGYGEPNLYATELKFEVAGKVSDAKAFQTGVRQFTFSEQGGALRMWINGRRFVPRGGNWGFGESMLRYRAREYEVAMRYHRDMNFTMVRNWVGQIGDEEMYDAADRNGIVIWHDFWLANPWDGPDPDNDAMFMANARDMIRMVRTHASVGLYCGRNEGFPPKALEDGLQESIAELHPGMHYIPSSADDVVSGHGPYQAMPVKFYYTQRATKKMHSELGMPNIMTLDSVKATMPESAMWPQGDMWGLHDFSLTGAQGASSFRDRIEKSYGGAASAAEWTTLAQFVNYEGHRAMFESQSKYRMGLLIWMSHPTWPSFVWQTYDYFFEPTAAYFGCKKASEPLHIQWNQASDQVEVVNYSAGDRTGLTASIQILNLDGSVKWERSATVDSPEDSVSSPIKIEFPEGLTPTHFLRLRLMKDAAVLSENLYWRGTEEGNYRAIRDLPKVKLETSTKTGRKGGQWILTTELRNTSAAPVLLVRLKPVRERSGDRILPALFSDNYVTLMPGERRTVTIELADVDARGEAPKVVVEGFNSTM